MAILMAGWVCGAGGGNGDKCDANLGSLMMCEHGEIRGQAFCAMCRHAKQPALPYAGTSGWSGSQTSYERVKIVDESGATAKYQKMFLSDLRKAGNDGLTSREWGLTMTEADIMRCCCGAWYYIGKPCGFCLKWAHRG
jgi:hypothetical protein